MLLITFSVNVDIFLCSQICFVVLQLLSMNHSELLCRICETASAILVLSVDMMKHLFACPPIND